MPIYLRFVAVRNSLAVSVHKCAGGFSMGRVKSLRIFSWNVAYEYVLLFFILTIFVTLFCGDRC